MEYPYTPPVFLQNQTVDEIHARMLKELPGNIDKSEMQIPWDFTRPAAIEKAEFVEFELNETIRTMFPQWASGEWLDQHAKMNGVRRRSANHATGFLTLAGNEETIIEEGLTIATGKNVPTSVVFKTTEKITLAKGSYQIIDTAGKEVLQLSLKKPENPGYLLTIRPKKDELEPKGELLLSDSENVLDSYSFAMSDEINWVEALLGAASESEYFSLEKIENGIDASNLQPYKTINGELVGCRVSIQAEEGGYSGNVPPNSITNIIDQIDGLNAVTNPEATSGGTPEEDDDTLRERIIESARHGVSFTGCAADYIRWAKEVSGVGNVVCVPLAEGPGTVRLYIMDANGGRANDETVEEVRNHILCPDDPIGRLAPIGA